MQNKEQKKIIVNSSSISCDGESGQSNHPIIYLNLGTNNSVTCPYCGIKFIKNKNK